jgi:glycerol-3-phosphate dehydrogenase
MKSRAVALQSIANNSFDICVIGGGATGAGCALDAQLRGLRTVLIEAADFASGASSASTKMVHGGVRYLEKAVRQLDLSEYKVVKRALRERARMLRNAPFLTRTRQLMTPCYSRREVAYYEIGLKLYDWIAGKAGLAPSRFLSRAEALRHNPALNPVGLVGAVAYTDGQFDDARYNIALVETFAAAGGEALNYARVCGFQKDAAEKIISAEVEDRVSGEPFLVRAGAFVNATGPHADALRQMASPGAPRRMRPSRGVHIVLPLDLPAGGDALLIPKTEDGRVLFAIPWRGRLLVGTTDEPVDQPEASAVSGDEIEYLLRHLNRYLAKPAAPEEIVSAFAGVRPLVSSGGARGRATKELARDHVVEVEAASGLVSAMGGKWTTYRAMAEDTIDAVERQLNRPHVDCRTASYPLIGSEAFAADLWRNLGAQFRIPESSAQHLTSKFGSRAAQVLALTKEDPALAEPLLASPDALGDRNLPSLIDASALAATRAEVVFCARYEMAVSVEDILARRLGLESYGWGEALVAAPAVAELLARELHWPPDHTRRALESYSARLHRLMNTSASCKRRT